MLHAGFLCETMADAIGGRATHDRRSASCVIIVSDFPVGLSLPKCSTVAYLALLYTLCYAQDLGVLQPPPPLRLYVLHAVGWMVESSADMTQILACKPAALMQTLAVSDERQCSHMVRFVRINRNSSVSPLTPHCARATGPHRSSRLRKTVLI